MTSHHMLRLTLNRTPDPQFELTPSKTLGMELEEGLVTEYQQLVASWYSMQLRLAEQHYHRLLQALELA